MFFDLSLPEIVVLLGLGVVLFGPEKLPHAAATAARFLQQVRAFSESTREGLRKELGPEFDGLDFKDLNPKAFVRKNLLGDNLLGETADLRALHVELDEDLRSALNSMNAKNLLNANGTLPAGTPQASMAQTSVVQALVGSGATAERTALAVGERPAFDEDAT